mgnify:CR=1 FL=1
MCIRDSHRAAGDEDSGDVEPQGGQQHAGGDLVAVADADQCVGGVGVDHVFDRVGDQLAAGQRVEPVSYTHLRAHETVLDLVCRLLLEKKQAVR